MRGLFQLKDPLFTLVLSGIMLSKEDWFVDGNRVRGGQKASQGLYLVCIINRKAKNKAAIQITTHSKDLKQGYKKKQNGFSAEWKT